MKTHLLLRMLVFYGLVVYSSPTTSTTQQSISDQEPIVQWEQRLVNAKLADVTTHESRKPEYFGQSCVFMLSPDGIGSKSDVLTNMSKKLEELDYKITRLVGTNKDFVKTQNTSGDGKLGTIGVSIMPCQDASMTIMNRLDEISNEMKTLKSDILREVSSKQNKIHDPSLINSNDENIAKDCFELQFRYGYTKSGIYLIKPLMDVFEIYCDMETDGGGWAVLQNRFDGSVDFYRNWKDYKEGFGNMSCGEFWLGLEKIHQLTYNQITKLRIDLVDFKQSFKHAIYTNFNVGTLAEGYPLRSIGTYSGTAGDGLTTQLSQKFSTFDNDQDTWPNNCAETFIGAWWYAACHTSNLNGKYHEGDAGADLENKVVIWAPFGGGKHSLKKSKMMVRRTF